MNKATTPSAETPAASTASDATGQTALNFIREIAADCRDVAGIPGLELGERRTWESIANRCDAFCLASPVPEQPKSEGVKWVSGEEGDRLQPISEILQQFSALRASHEELLEALKKAILWTDSEYDVGDWREKANDTVKKAEAVKKEKHCE